MRHRLQSDFIGPASILASNKVVNGLAASTCARECKSHVMPSSVGKKVEVLSYEVDHLKRDQTRVGVRFVPVIGDGVQCASL